MIIAKYFNFKLYPVGIFIYQWIILISFILLFCQGFIRLNYDGLFYILFSLLFCSLGYISPNLIKARKNSNANRKVSFNKNKAKKILIILVILSFINPLYSLLYHGIDLSMILSFESLLEVNNQMSIDRYTNDDTSLFNQIFLIFTYVSPLFGGFCFRLMDKKPIKYLCIFTIFSGVFIALTQAVKMALITSIILWFAGFLVCSITYNLSIKLKVKNFLILVLLLVVFISILFISMMMRTGEFNIYVLKDISQKFIVYALGSVPCFDLWYSNEFVTYYSFGVKTFYGISNFLGIAHRDQGIYQDFIYFGKDGFEAASNVYTIFRTLIEDYGKVGGCIFLFLLGVCSNLSKHEISIRNNLAFNQSVLMVLYAYFLWSFGASFFSYTSYFAMIVVIYIILKKTQKCV